MSKKSKTYLMLIVAVIIIVAIVAAVYYPLAKTTPTGTTTIASTAKPISQSYIVQITDPLTAPPAAQAVVMSYSNVQLHAAAGSVNAQGNGTLNLSSIQNGNAETIAVVKNATNESFESVSFVIDSAKVNINGTNYTIAAPAKITANITANATAKSNRGMLIDVSSTVLQLYSNSTNKYVLLTSPIAVNLTEEDVNSGNAAYVGANASITSQQSAALLGQVYNFSIENASVVSSGNSTTINVTIKSNASVPITIKTILLSGYMREESPSIKVVSTNSSSNVSANASLSDIISPIILNYTVLSDINATGNFTSLDGLYVLQAQDFSNDYHNSLNFVIGSSGGMQLPQSQSNLTSYTILPGENKTFRFDGIAMLHHNGNIAVLLPNQSYSVEAISSFGALAFYDINASYT